MPYFFKVSFTAPEKLFVSLDAAAARKRAIHQRTLKFCAVPQSRNCRDSFVSFLIERYFFPSFVLHRTKIPAIFAFSHRSISLFQGPYIPQRTSSEISNRFRLPPPLLSFLLLLTSLLQRGVFSRFRDTLRVCLCHSGVPAVSTNERMKTYTSPAKNTNPTNKRNGAEEERDS